MSKSPAMDLVMQFMGKQNTIPTPVPLIRLLGDHAAAAFLSQCLYWGERTEDAQGWFHKTHEEWEEELVLSADQVRRCVRTCGSLVEVKRKGIPARNYYRANREEVAAALERLANGNREPISRSGETQHQGADKPNDKPQTNPTAVDGESPQQVVRETQVLITEPTSEPTQNLQQKENTLAADAAAGETGRTAEALEPQNPNPTTPAADLRPAQDSFVAAQEPSPATDLEKVPPAAPPAPGQPAATARSSQPSGKAQARRLSDAARLIAAWNDHRGTLPEVQGLNEGRKKALKKLIRDCDGDIDRATQLVADATREVAADDYWKTHRYGFDNLVPAKVFQRAEAWRSRHHAPPPSSATSPTDSDPYDLTRYDQ